VVLGDGERETCRLRASEVRRRWGKAATSEVQRARAAVDPTGEEEQCFFSFFFNFFLSLPVSLTFFSSALCTFCSFSLSFLFLTIF